MKKMNLMKDLEKKVEIGPGKGLLAQLEEGQKHIYKPLTQDELYSQLKEIDKAQRIDMAIKWLQHLFNTKNVTTEECEKLTDMIVSNDPESFDLAISLMEQRDGNK